MHWIVTTEASLLINKNSSNKTTNRIFSSWPAVYFSTTHLSLLPVSNINIETVMYKIVESKLENT